MSTLEVNSIQPLSSGSTITLGASGKTLSIPSGCTITNSGTATGFGGGKVGQLITATQSTASTTSSSSFGDINISANITPSATDSKIYIQCMVSVLVTRSNAEVYGRMKLVRDSTDIYTQGSQNFGGYTGGASALQIMATLPILFIDTPSTTSQITYKLQGANSGGGSTTFHYQNTPSTMQLLEILA